MQIPKKSTVLPTQWDHLNFEGKANIGDFIFPRNYCELRKTHFIEKIKHIAHPAMAFYNNRLETFRNPRWPIQIKQTAERLAEAGWFYEKKSDCTTTFCCGISHENWLRDEDEWENHLQISARKEARACMLLDIFITGLERQRELSDITVWDNVPEVLPFGKIIFNRDEDVDKDEVAKTYCRLYNDHFMSYSNRLFSFDEGWNKQLIPKKEDLAEAGFYYEGIRDECRTFCCGKIVDNWKPLTSPMAPLYQHVKICNECGLLPFFKRYSGIKFVAASF